jgi:hypothetical protein
LITSLGFIWTCITNNFRKISNGKEESTSGKGFHAMGCGIMICKTRFLGGASELELGFKKGIYTL